MIGLRVSHQTVSVWVLLAAGVMGQARVFAGPEVVVGRDVSPSQRIPLGRIDHSLWDRLLRTFVDSKGLVNYSAWHSSSEAQAALDTYIAQLSAAKLQTGTREDQLAFFINAYNAVTIKGILRKYPTSSIRNHTARLVGYNIWKDLKLQVDGQAISLDAMEHMYLRKMGEPRIHFAIVCASIGCPKLLNEAYVPKRLEQQLVTNTQAFFADESKFRYDKAARKTELSPILSWFATDFGKTQAEQLRAIAPYVPAEAKDALTLGQVKVAFLDYDWNLNSQASPKNSGR